MPKKTPDIRKLLANDIRVELSEEFDRNFERKAFFDRPWPKSRRKAKDRGRGSLLIQTGKLRSSIRSKVNSNLTITWSTSERYAAIHNYGGTITVTKKMKAYAWYRYYQAAGSIVYTMKGSVSQSKKNLRLLGQAEMWYAIALSKVGSKINIPQRQFLGNHPRIREVCRSVLGDHLPDIAGSIVAPILPFSRKK